MGWIRLTDEASGYLLTESGYYLLGEEMADSIAQRIVSALMARVADILVSGGYATDCGKGVHWGVRTVGLEMLPCVVVWPEPEIMQSRLLAGTPATFSRRVGFEAIHSIQSGIDPGITGERLIADLKVALLGPADQTVGGLVEYLELSESSSALKEDGSSMVGGVIYLTAHYIARYGDPYIVD